MCNAKLTQGEKKLKNRGAFICIEGIDGSGKTTQAKLLANRLKISHNAIYTAEPSRGKIGTYIKKSYLYGEKRLSIVLEALLFAADRIEHLENEIFPSLDKGRLVISDRYVYSSLAYQGAAGLSLNWIQKINEHALEPDLGVFIDVNPETVMSRLKPKKSVMENIETQEKVREIYLKFVEDGKLIRIDGNKSKNEVSKEIYAVVMKFLNAPY
jgi:dTMP kinase